jgi:hypothetical protein
MNSASKPALKPGLIVLIVFVGVLLAVPILLFVPIPTAFTRTVPYPTPAYYHNASYPGYLDVGPAAQVSGTWSASNGQYAVLTIVNGNGQIVLSYPSAPAGSFSFIATAPPYYFLVVIPGGGSITVQGQVVQPLIESIVTGT